MSPNEASVMVLPHYRQYTIVSFAAKRSIVHQFRLGNSLDKGQELTRLIDFSRSTFVSNQICSQLYHELITFMWHWWRLSVGSSNTQLFIFWDTSKILRFVHSNHTWKPIRWRLSFCIKTGGYAIRLQFLIRFWAFSQLKFTVQSILLCLQ